MIPRRAHSDARCGPLTKEMQVSFQRFYSGAPWEQKVGYCRALRAGDRVFVTGTASVTEGGAYTPSVTPIGRP